MSQELLNCVELIHPRKDDTVTHSVIWMHGLGANAHDFVPVPPYFRLPEALNIRFVFPNAPAMPVTINNGYIMPAWYDLLTMDIGGIREDEMGIRKSITDINALIEMDAQSKVINGTKYPAVFVRSGMNDARVVPWMPAKFAAALQNSSISNKPILLYVNYGNGHFTSDIDVNNKENADMFSFALWQVGHPKFTLKK